MAFDTTRLVEQIKLKGGIAQGRFEDPELLEIAYDHLLSEMLPQIIDKREEFYGRYIDIELEDGVAAYPIITRALGGTLREVQLIHLNDDAIDDLKRTEVDKIGRRLTGKPTEIYLEGPNLVLVPTPDSGAAAQHELRQHYFLRPSKFVAVDKCARISTIDRPNKIVTVSNVPSGWGGIGTFDIVRGRAHFDPLAIDQAGIVSGNQVTFSEDLPRDLLAGDYVSYAEESCFPCLPIEGHAALVWGSIATAMASMGHPKADWAQGKSDKALISFGKLIKVRIQGAQKALGARFL